MKKLLSLLAVTGSITLIQAQEPAPAPAPAAPSATTAQATVQVAPAPQVVTNQPRIDPTNWDSLPPVLQQRLTKTFDANKDGTLDPQEKAAALNQLQTSFKKSADRKQEILNKFDTNKNGKLDPDELEAVKTSFQRQRLTTAPGSTDPAAQPSPAPVAPVK